LFSRFNKSIQTLFVDLHSESFIVNEKVNVILSPSLYWVKKVSLPLKNAREVKPLLPSLFEDILPEGIYSYYVYKEEESFFIFAYEDKFLIEILQKKNITLAQVNKIYFAQSEFSSLKEAVSINETQSICSKEGMLILLPTVWMKETSDLNLAQRELSKHAIRLKQYGHIVKDTSIYKAIGFVAILLLLFTTQLFITSSRANTLELQKSELFSKNGLKPTMLQNRSLLHSLEKTHEKQMALREDIARFLQVRLQSPQELSLLRLKRNVLLVEFTHVKRGTERSIAKYLQSKGLNFKATFKNETLSLKVYL